MSKLIEIYLRFCWKVFPSTRPHLIVLLISSLILFISIPLIANVYFGPDSCCLVFLIFYALYIIPLFAILCKLKETR